MPQFVILYLAKRTEMAIPTITATTLFNLNVTPKLSTFTDTTDYAAASIATSDVAGVLTITGPSGIFYSNSDYNAPDILPSVSTSFDRNIPLNSSGHPLQGSYSFAYSIRVRSELVAIVFQDGALGDFIGFQGDVTSNFYVGQTIVVETGVNAGSYTVNQVTGYNSNLDTTFVRIDQQITPTTDDADTYFYNFYSQLFSYEFCYATPQIDIEQTYDCDCSKLLSRDLTNYTINVCGGAVAPTTIARVHTLYAPLGENGQPVASTIVSSLPSILATPLWTNNWRSTVSTTLTYTLPTGLQVQLLAYGEENIFVSCSNGLCCVYECLTNLYRTYNSLMDSNPTQGQKYQKLWQEAVGAWMLYSIATSCGNSNRQKYLNIIIDIAKATNCDCCNEERQDVSKMIVPICGLPTGGGTGSGSTVVTAGNGIDVSYSNVGSTDTWQVSLDEAVVEGIVAQYIADNPLVFGDLSVSFLAALESFVNGFISINNLGGVTINSPQSGQILEYNGTDWVNVPNPVPYNKVYLLNSFVTSQSLNATGAYTNLQQTLAVATGNNPLSVNGDTIEFEIKHYQTSGLGNVVGVAFNGTAFVLGLFANTGSSQSIVFKGIITRISATSLQVECTKEFYVNGTSAAMNFKETQSSTETVADISATPLVISPFKSVNAGTSDCTFANYKSIKK